MVGKGALTVTALATLLRILSRDEKCNECGIRGHFSVCCRKENSKVPQERNQERDESRKKKAYQVDEEDNQRTREEYAFAVAEGQSSAGGDYAYGWWSPAG